MHEGTKLEKIKTDYRLRAPSLVRRESAKKKGRVKIKNHRHAAVSRGAIAGRQCMFFFFLSIDERSWERGTVRGIDGLRWEDKHDKLWPYLKNNQEIKTKNSICIKFHL